MIKKFKIFENSIISLLKKRCSVYKRSNEYALYVNSEFSISRLTKDDDGNHYFRNYSNDTFNSMVDDVKRFH